MSLPLRQGDVAFGYTSPHLGSVGEGKGHLPFGLQTNELPLFLGKQGVEGSTIHQKLSLRSFLIVSRDYALDKGQSHNLYPMQSRGDRTPIELFVAGIAGLPSALPALGARR